MPIVVAAGLMLLAVGNLVLALRGGDFQNGNRRRTSDLLILGSPIATIVLIGVAAASLRPSRSCLPPPPRPSAAARFWSTSRSGSRLASPPI
jgi:hypothetical protein